jgi:uncharacterized protein
MLKNDSKLQALHAVLSAHQPGVIAVSGGVDSTFLAAAAQKWGLDYLAVFLAGPHISPQDRNEAVNSVRQSGLTYLIGDFSPLDVPGAADNGKKRCYHCKAAMIRAIQDQAGGGRNQIMDGSHLSDSMGYRPGRRALAEHGVRSPLSEAGMVKEDIRAYARYLGLQQADMPSRPCLMTRFAYGYPMNAMELYQVGRAEDDLRKTGLSLFRIRIPAQGLVLLHVHHSQKDMVSKKRTAIDKCMQQAGLPEFSLDLVQTLSGYFDQSGPNNPS